jgi:hypothetical protein
MIHFTFLTSTFKQWLKVYHISDFHRLQIALWLVPIGPYFIGGTKANILKKSAWGLVCQQLDVHRKFKKKASTIRREVMDLML